VDLGTRFHLLECGVDWMTATAGKGARADAIAHRSREYALERSCEGYQLKPWAWNGYVGQVVDGCSWGRREDGVIVRLSGSMATRHWKSMLVFADNVSRLDVQVTVLDQEAVSNLALNVYRKAGEHPMVQSGMTTTKYTESTPTGSTCNVGSRSSDRYMRLYDKTAESGGEYPNRSWRYEIEYKNRRAYKVASAILASRHEALACHERVCAAWKDYGIAVPGPCPTLGWRDAGVVHATDDQRRLEWVRKCIRPVIGRLVEAYDAETVAAALGFTIYPNNSPLGVSWWESVEEDAPISIR